MVISTYLIRKPIVIAIVFLVASYYTILIFQESFPQNVITQTKDSIDQGTLAGSDPRDSLPITSKLDSDVEEARFLELLEGKGDVKLAQDDQRLVEYVREHFIIPPSKGPLHLKWNRRDPAYESESETILELVEKAGGSKTGGFFIEAGANDGELMSNTLMFEQLLNWTGLLVEVDPKGFAKLKEKRRNAWISNVGLSSNLYPEKITFTNEMMFGSVAKKKGVRYTMQTIPLYTLLLAIGHTEIDFLCLDVDVLTKSVLYTLPLDKINIKATMVETVLEPDHGEEMKEYLEDNGFTFYKYHRTMAYNDNRINDIILYKEKTN